MIHNCNDCNKKFTTAPSLKRHREAFHEETRVKYQCWNCHRTYARKENVLTHSRKEHQDTEGKFVIISTTNTRYNPEISQPDPWTPPFEARQRKASNQPTIYKIKIPSTPVNNKNSAEVDIAPASGKVNRP